MTKVSRIVYLAASTLFLVGVSLQVFLAGMVVVALRTGWGNHRDLGHALALPLLIMLLTAYLGRLPNKIKWMTWLLLGVYIIQSDVIIFMRASYPYVSAFHPVLALVDFGLGAFLVYQVWKLVQDDREERPIPTKLVEA
jgi:membrane-bound metal-dependent hydrolase YbcI (DUF457 family)